MNTDIRELLDEWNKNVGDEERMNSFMYGDVRGDTVDDDSITNQQTQEVKSKIKEEYKEDSRELSTFDSKTKYNIIYDVDPEYDLAQVDGNKLRYEYKVGNILKNDEIEFTTTVRIHIVPFLFSKCRGKHPFLSYLAYTQIGKSVKMKSDDKVEEGTNQIEEGKINSGSLVFPHINLDQYKNMFTNNEDKRSIQSSGDEYFQKLFKRKMKTIGYLKHSDYNEYFLFYDFTDRIDDLVFKDYRRSYKWKWISSGDIMYSGKVLDYDIHSTIISTFRRYKELIYVYLNKKYYMLPLTLYSISDMEDDNNFKYPMSRSRDENTTFMYDFFNEEGIKKKRKDGDIHIGRYFVFYRKVFISNTNMGIDYIEKNNIYLDNFDCIIDNVDGNGMIQLKSNEQFMFVDSNFYSANTINE